MSAWPGQKFSLPLSGVDEFGNPSTANARFVSGYNKQVQWTTYIWLDTSPKASILVTHHCETKEVLVWLWAQFGAVCVWEIGGMGWGGWVHCPGLQLLYFTLYLSPLSLGPLYVYGVCTCVSVYIIAHHLAIEVCTYAHCSTYEVQWWNLGECRAIPYQLLAFPSPINEYHIADIFSGGLIFAIFTVVHHPRKFNPQIIHIHVLVLMLLVWVRGPRVA